MVVCSGRQWLLARSPVVPGCTGGRPLPFNIPLHCSRPLSLRSPLAVTVFLFLLQGTQMAAGLFGIWELGGAPSTKLYYQVSCELHPHRNKSVVRFVLQRQRMTTLRVMESNVQSLACRRLILSSESKFGHVADLKLSIFHSRQFLSSPVLSSSCNN